MCDTSDGEIKPQATTGRLRLHIIHHKNCPQQLLGVGFTQEQAAEAARLWTWCCTMAEAVQVLVGGDSCALTCGDLRRLACREWLSDAVIDAFMNALLDSPDRGTIAVPVGCAGALLHSWAQRRARDVQGATRLVIPLNMDNEHWMVAVACRAEGTLTYFDSKRHGHGESVVDREPHVQQACATLQVLYPSTTHAMQVSEPLLDLPKVQQANNCDCGAFVCANAWCCINGLALLTRKDMGFFRRFMLHVLFTRMRRCR
jgi:Ulp1 family protease